MRFAFRWHLVWSSLVVQCSVAATLCPSTIFSFESLWWNARQMLWNMKNAESLEFPNNCHNNQTWFSISMHPCWTHKSSMIKAELQKSWPCMARASAMLSNAFAMCNRSWLSDYPNMPGVIGSQANHKGTIIRWKSLKCVNLHYTRCMHCVVCPASCGTAPEPSSGRGQELDICCSFRQNYPVFLQHRLTLGSHWDAACAFSFRNDITFWLSNVFLLPNQRLEVLPLSHGLQLQDSNPKGSCSYNWQLHVTWQEYHHEQQAPASRPLKNMEKTQRSLVIIKSSNFMNHQHS